MTSGELKAREKQESLKIRDIVAFKSPVTVCVNKEDFDQLIAVENEGHDSAALFASLPGCDSIPLPRVLLSQKLADFQFHDGRKFWYVQVQSLDGGTILYVGIPATLFSPEE